MLPPFPSLRGPHHLKYTRLNVCGEVGNAMKYVCRTCHETIHLMTKLDPKISIKTATQKLRQSRSAPPREPLSNA